MTTATLTAALRPLLALVFFALTIAGGCTDAEFAQMEAADNFRAQEELLVLDDLWLTIDEATPGVYYDLVDGACPHGGQQTAAGCMVAPITDATIDYRFEKDAVEPGIYYDLINGDCLVGGVALDGACKLAPILAENTPDASARLGHE